ncbi:MULTISPECIES: MucR family transcriptional regulator [Gordonia]|uniref:Uncharacterized protein n=2 Tax=Gordonia TaxID=2053 RepID=L7LQ52_9ACTN|nr:MULTISPECIES: MucR family transcriptional regulator [Gordonia]GAC62208.1 hypothetical protein GSI01S_30_00160 [Gordonia sihwensis NBRC 108236]
MPIRGERGPVEICEAWECDRPQHARRLCLMHYKREQRGVDVRSRPEKIFGDPSGHGLYGVLDDDGTTVLCHECGQRFESVGAHVGGAHGMSAAEYKARHGLARGTALISQASHQRRSEASKARLGSAGWRRFEAKRDPLAASASRDMDQLRGSGVRAQTQASRAESSAKKGKATRVGRVYECVMCGATWCQFGGARQARTCSYECWAAWETAVSMQEAPPNADRDRQIRDAAAQGVSATDLAARYGVTPDRIRQIVRRDRKDREALLMTEVREHADDERTFYTQRAAAAYVGRSDTALRNWIKREILPPDPPWFASDLVWARDEALRRQARQNEAMRALGTTAEHGTVARYSYGCRCDACRAASSDERQYYRERKRREQQGQ